MTKLEVLEAAYRLIEDPRRWTQCAQARDRWGHRVETASPKAVRWCAIGAIGKVLNNSIREVQSERQGAYKALRHASEDMAGVGTLFVNDCGTRKEAHAAILKVYELAIQRAKADLET